MLYGIFADIVVLVHLVWILFLIAGAYWGRRSWKVRAVHLTGLGFASVSQVFGWYCPLTHLEVRLRDHQNPAATYPGSFIAYYAEKLVYIRLSPTVIFVLTVGLIGINVLISTIGHWTNGVMDHEWLFWDSQALMKQVGLTG